MVNQLKTILLLGLLTSGLIAAGSILGPTMMTFAIIAAVVLNVGGYYFSDRIVLKMHRAVEIGPSDSPALHEMTRELAANSGIPTPRLYMIPANYPNAFATGRNPQHGVVAVTSGLCQMLSEREIRGVIAHEIAHIKNRDVLIATIAAMVAAAITYIANIVQFSAFFGGMDDEEGPSPVTALAFAFVAPLVAGLVQMAISRSRENLADSYAAKITGDPEALASALQKLTNAAETIREEPSPATASLFIVNPLHGGIANLFSTHPSAADRIARLMAMREQFGGAAIPLVRSIRGTMAVDSRSGWSQNA